MLSAQTADADEDASDLSVLQKPQTFAYTTVIVFGEGPVKPVLLEEEVTSQEKVQWYKYIAAPTHHAEPDFWLMQQPRSLAELKKISINKELTAEEKRVQKEAVRKNWQKKGWLAMKQWGRQNALAAGLALYKGLTKTVILTGGKTLCKEMKGRISKERLAEWPSEAELMADIIRTTYGDLYKKKYGRDIDEAIRIENASTNTLENFACTINKYPELLTEKETVGFLTAGHHLDRVQLLAQLFSLKGGKLCAQEILRTMQVEENELSNQFEDLSNSANSAYELRKNQSLKKGLEDPTYLTFWIGYVAMVRHPKVLHNIMKRFSDPEWGTCGEKIFAKVGLKLSDYRGKDLVELAQKDAATFNYLMTKLQELRKPEYRTIPPMREE